MLQFSNSISNTKKFFQRTINTFKSFLSKRGNTYEKLPKTPSFIPFSCGRNDTTKNNIETGYEDLDNFYTEFTNNWDSHKSSKNTVFTATKQSSQKLCTDQTVKVQNRNCQFAAETEEDDSSVRINTTYTENNAERRLDDDDQIVKYKSLQKLCTDQTVKFQNRNCQFAVKTEEGDSSVRINTAFTENNAERRSEKDDQIVKYKSSEVYLNDQLMERRLSCVEHKLKELELMDMGNVNHKLDVQQVLHYYSRLTCPPYLHIVDKFFMEICAEFFSSQHGARDEYLNGNRDEK